MLSRMRDKLALPVSTEPLIWKAYGCAQTQPTARASSG
jgi:hypothetical protein